MKNKMFMVALAAAAVAATTISCNKNELPSQEASEGSTVISAVIPETKVSFQTYSDGKYPLAWNASGEVIRAFCRANGAWIQATNSSSYTTSEDRKTASFTINLPEVESGNRDYYIASPATMTYQILAANASDYLDKVRLDSKITPQVPTATGPDSRFILMISKHEGCTVAPAKMNVDFSVLEAFGKMTVTGLDAASVSAIKIIFPGKSHVTGFLDYKISTDETILTKASSSTNYIEINPKNISVNSTSFDVWFGIAPQTFAAGESIKFSFTTPSGDIVKETTVPAGKTLAFTRGKATGFTVDMSGVGKKDTKELSFDFSSAPKAGFPTNAWEGRATGTFDITASDGNSYTFFYDGGVFFNTNRLTIYENIAKTPAHGYLGLPAISGYKLVGIAADRTNNTGATVKLEITSARPKTDSSQSLTGEITWTSGVAKPQAITLGGTAAGTMYYLHSLANTWVPFNGLTLTYESE